MNLRILLLPFTAIYYIIIYIRNKFYDIGLFKTYSPGVPVISVGNISTGGTGKTPTVILLAEQLINANKRIAVISRGYKRKTNKSLLVFDGAKILCGPDECGDEVYMIAEYFKNQKNVIIAVGNDKYETAKYITAKFKPDVIILDDAFQHRKIARNIDLVLLDMNDIYKNKFSNSYVLPAGNLREGLRNLNRADIILKNFKFDISKESKDFDNYCNEIYNINYHYHSINSDKAENIIIDKPLIAFCGIAKPDSFFLALEDKGFRIKEKISFKDHFEYEKSDIENLIKYYSDDISFITTEKDFIKIKHFREFTDKYPVYYLKISVYFEKGFDKFQNTILKLF